MSFWRFLRLCHCPGQAVLTVHVYQRDWQLTALWSTPITFWNSTTRRLLQNSDDNSKLQPLGSTLTTDFHQLLSTVGPLCYLYVSGCLVRHLVLWKSFHWSCMICFRYYFWDIMAVSQGFWTDCFWNRYCLSFHALPQALQGIGPKR